MSQPLRPAILVVDDDERIRLSVSRALAPQAREVRAAESAERALAMLAEAPPDVILCDVRMPGMDGIEFLRLLRKRTPEIAVILMTAYDDLSTVATAMREGAADFLIKPLDLHQLRRVLEKVVTERAQTDPIRPSATETPRGADGLVGRDPRMIEIFKVVGQVAGTRANVVIRGESGTGKELIAQAIHSSSPWAREPFVAVNCTALPPTLLESELFGHVRGSFTGATGDRRGRFALAGRGTIFLDEIGDTTPEFQAKLLRVLQEHEFYPVGAERPGRTEARVIAATHRDLEKLVAAGSFREDLYYRLRVVEIVVPPLRERMGDVPLLTAHLVRKASRAVGRESPHLSAAALAALLVHSWPGNVRELENCLTRAVVLGTGGVIQPEHLGLAPPSPTDSPPPLGSLEQVEREHVITVFRAVGGHKRRAARILGISRPRLDRLLKKHLVENEGGDADG